MVDPVIKSLMNELSQSVTTDSMNIITTAIIRLYWILTLCMNVVLAWTAL